MADGIYKSGVAIMVTYQAVNKATGKTIVMDVYDEAHAKDTPQCVAAMTEIGATGRYYASFTPDAEGEWHVLINNSTDSNGEVFKSFAVEGHNIDSIGDAVDGIQTDLSNETDGLGALKTLIDSANTALGEAGAGLTSIPAPSGMLVVADLADFATSAEIAGITSPAMVG